jgi:hypothetical protein
MTNIPGFLIINGFISFLLNLLFLLAGAAALAKIGPLFLMAS